MKKANSWVVLIFGLLILILGYVGYLKGGSTVSLYSGVGFGALLILSGCLMFFHVRFSPYMALFLTLALTVTFAIRYSITHKGLPAILAVVSGGMLLFLLGRVIPWKR